MSMVLVSRDFQMWLFLLGLCFNYSNAHVLCYNNKLGCPDETITCTDDKRCCTNSTCDQRATWSMLNSTCPKDVEDCPSNMYCSYESEKRSCTPKGVSICDDYLHIHDISSCNERSFLINQMFESCSQFYIDDHNRNSQLVASIMECAERCIIDRAKNMASNATLCNGLQYKVYVQYPECFSKCDVCSRSDSWIPAILRVKSIDSRYADIIDDIAIECNNQFKKDYDESKAAKIKDKIYEFVAIFKTATSINTQRHFEKLLLLIHTPQPLQTTENPRDVQNVLKFDFKLISVSLIVLLLLVSAISISALVLVSCCRKRPNNTLPHNVPFLQSELQVPPLPPTPVPSPSRGRRTINSPSSSGQDSKYVSLDSNQYELRKPSNELFVHMKALSK